MRAPASHGTDLRNALLGKGTGKARVTSAGGRVDFAAALTQSLTESRTAKSDDGSPMVPVTTGEGGPVAALEKAVPGSARERKSSERRRDGTEHDVAPGVVTLPFEQLRVRGLGMDAGGASDLGRASPASGEPVAARTSSTRVIAGHVLGLSLASESAGREPTTAAPTTARTFGETNVSAPHRAPAEAPARAPEARVDGPSMAPARSAANEVAVPELRLPRGEAAPKDVSSTAQESRNAVGAAAVLERSDVIASARQELGHSVSAKPSPPGPTVEALPVGLGGALPTAAQREAGAGHGSRDGSRDGDAHDRDDRAHPIEDSRSGSASAFVAPATEAGSQGATPSAPAGARPEVSSTPERVAEVIEQLDVRNVEAGRNTSPLKVNLGELGEVRVSVTREDGLLVRLDASDPRAASAFETGRRELELALESHGLRELRVAVDGVANRASTETAGRPVPERVQLGPLGAETHGRPDERDGQMGQDRSGRQGSDGRENGAHDERDHREAVNAAIERRERERRFAPAHGPATAGRRLGSA